MTNDLQGLALWEKVESVDRKYTKPITGRDFQGNSVNINYTARKLTEVLGPAGLNWGWNVVDDKIVEYGSHERKDFTAVHVVRMRLWMRRQDGTEGSFEDYGTTKVSYYAGKGADRYLKTDEEFAKKSASDAKSKLFVALGGSAELWLGEFDRSQHKYIVDDDDRATRQQSRRAPEPPRDEPAPKAPLPPRVTAPSDPYTDVGEHTFALGKKRLTGPEWLDAISQKARDPKTDPVALRTWWDSPEAVAERARFHKLKSELNKHLEAVKDEVMARMQPPANGKISHDRSLRAD